MSSTITNQIQQKLSCPRLPLAVYREIVAHLRQVEGVEVNLYAQTSPQFDYLQSQVGGLQLTYLPTEDRRTKVNGILSYYGNKYGSWINE